MTAFSFVSIAKSAVVSAVLATGFAASAVAADFAQLSAPVSGPVAISDVQIGAELQDKAEEYGERELDRLSNAFHDAVAEELERAGRFGLEGDAGANTLVLVIEDARPNRPTFEQLGRRPGLSAQSFSIGGAEVSAVLYDPNGVELGQFEYSWRSSNIRDARYRVVWSDAKRTFDRFADQLVDALDEAGS